MLDPQLLAFVIVAAVLTITPGADTMLVIRNTLRGGRPDGLLTAFGIIAGCFTHALISALGVSVILLHSATAFNTLKLLGAAYLIWLGVQSLRRARRSELPPLVAAAPGVGVHRRQALVEGLVTNLLNPKVAIFYLALLPQFIAPGDAVLPRSLLLAAIHNVMGLIWLAAIAAAFDRMRSTLTRGGWRRWLDGIAGGLLIALGARLALAER